MSDVSSVTKYFPKAKEGFATTLSSSISSGATTVPLNSVSGYTNGDTVALVVDPEVSTKKQVFTGVVDTSGTQITNVVWTEGTNVAHSAGATVADYTTATHMSMISTGMLQEHSPGGAHTTDTISEKTSGAGVTVDGVKLKDGTIQTADAISPVYTSNPYKFSVYLTSAHNVGTSATKVNFDTKNFDTGSNVDVTTNKGRFTAPVDGFYQFNANVYVSTAGTGTSINILLYKNGSVITRGSKIIAAAANDPAATVSAFLRLSANDYIEVYVSTAVAVKALSASAASDNTFSGFLVSTT